MTVTGISILTVNVSIHSSPELTIVVPTYNERDNIGELVSRLDLTLAGIHWEVIFVDDDSGDKTADRVREIGSSDSRVRCIQRIGRRGLSSAVIEGMMATNSTFIAVMDADLQHDESLLPKMLSVLRTDDVDLVIGSRLVAGGDNKSLQGLRHWSSEFSSKLARWILKIEVRDLMSGYFMLRSEVVAESVRKLSGVGFKILLDVLASSPRDLKYVELPYRFRSRHSGDSKLDSNAAVALAMTLIDKKLGWLLPPRVSAFLFVGGSGVIVHFAALTVLLKLSGLSFVLSQTIATLVAMTSNYIINNLFTYRDVRLRGWNWLTGWVSFTLACGFGAVANVGVASTLFREDFSWGISAFAGILVGTSWNYGVTRLYTWRVR
jgi:dolichol-phosphate mannosyltransferase